MGKSSRIAARFLRQKTAGYPTSLFEWETYVKTLVGEPLFSKTVAVNTQAFADKLREDGFSMLDFQKILLMFVRQCRAVDVRIPLGGALDLVTLSRTDPTARRGQTATLEEIEALEKKPSPKGTDDLDQMFSKFESDQ